MKVYKLKFKKESKFRFGTKGAILRNKDFYKGEWRHPPFGVDYYANYFLFKGGLVFDFFHDVRFLNNSIMKYRRSKAYEIGRKSNQYTLSFNGFITTKPQLENWEGEDPIDDGYFNSKGFSVAFDTEIFSRRMRPFERFTRENSFYSIGLEIGINPGTIVSEFNGYRPLGFRIARGF